MSDHINWSRREISAAAEGISPREEIRNELINLRNRSMSQWPDAIPVTLALTHAIWWLDD
jgi:hypothetical protein